MNSGLRAKPHFRGEYLYLLKALILGTGLCFIDFLYGIEIHFLINVWQSLIPLVKKNHQIKDIYFFLDLWFDTMGTYSSWKFHLPLSPWPFHCVQASSFCTEEAQSRRQAPPATKSTCLVYDRHRRKFQKTERYQEPPSWERHRERERDRERERKESLFIEKLSPSPLKAHRSLTSLMVKD